MTCKQRTCSRIWLRFLAVTIKVRKGLRPMRRSSVSSKKLPAKIKQMIPIKLELQGLYSYKEKQTVDFAQLTAAGLFGIFGAVGSGKSSILAAIMLALYGNTERLAARGEKTSMVNLQSDMLSISFEFKAGKNNREIYKATYISKRNKKNFDDVKPAEHLFYHKTEEGWMPIE